jgi:hypothetical protein
MGLQPIDDLFHRNAVRRERVGRKVTAETLNYEEFNAACDRFFKKRGMPTYTFHGDIRQESENETETEP